MERKKRVKDNIEKNRNKSPGCKGVGMFNSHTHTHTQTYTADVFIHGNDVNCMRSGAECATRSKPTTEKRGKGGK